MIGIGSAVVVGGVAGAIFAVPVAAGALGLSAAGPVAGGLFATCQSAGLVYAGGALATV